MSRFDVAKKLADDCRVLGRDVIGAFLAKHKEPLEGHAVVFLARATTALQGVEVLASAGLNADATSVSRTIMELLIDLRYILKEDTERRFQLFFGHENVRDWQEVKAIDRLHGKLPDTTTEAMRKIEARYDQVKAWYPNPHQWSGKTLRQRAVESDGIHGEHFYDLAYAEACSTSHSGPKGLRHAYSDTEDEQTARITLLVGARAPSDRPIVLACMGYVPLLGNVINSARLQAQFDDGHAALLARLNGLCAVEDD